MQSQDVEYDSVADLRVAVSDNEDDEFFYADAAMMDGSATQSWSRGDVSAVDPRVKIENQNIQSTILLTIILTAKCSKVHTFIVRTLPSDNSAGASKVMLESWFSVTYK